MVGVHCHGTAGAVGDEGVVAPVRPEGSLRAGQAGAAHDQPDLAQGGLGHLGDAGVGVVDRGPGGLVDRGDRRSHRGGLPDGDRKAQVVAAAGSQDLGRPEPVVAAQCQRAATAPG
jgi:hypothetical protein